jgi:benzoyl-CoA-dihydrodiol lyase
VLAQGADWWPLAMVRELDDAILHLRTNETAAGSSRSIYALVSQESCFVGTLLELLLVADRAYMRDNEPDSPQAYVTLSPMNSGALPTLTGLSRLKTRGLSPEQLRSAIESTGRPLKAATAHQLGLVTEIPDSLDWEDELRQAIENRTALSPDALTGMEANLRFPLPETQGTRVFGRLSAWQNWVFSRPNAVGTSGALKVYGTGAPSKFDWNRV